MGIRTKNRPGKVTHDMTRWELSKGKQVLNTSSGTVLNVSQRLYHNNKLNKREFTKCCLQYVAGFSSLVTNDIIKAMLFQKV